MAPFITRTGLAVYSLQICCTWITLLVVVSLDGKTKGNCTSNDKLTIYHPST